MHTWLIRILRFIPIRALYAFVFLFVVPVCLVVNPANRIIYRYFRSRWGYGALKSALMTYRNFYLFGQVVVDRFAMYAGKTFDVEVEGKEHYDKLVERPEGFMILSAHVGNYEIAGYTLRNEQKRLNALVFAGEKASVMQNRNKMFAQTNIRMIPLRADMSHIFEINNALADGQIVSMPADRMLGSAKSFTLPFLQGEAEFPQGPFKIAAARGASVLAINVMKASSKRYKIYVTPLSEPMPQSYVRELERVVGMYPAQWYNYFEFWK
jgi:predicted LPLAT superfamily acyltransferase